MILDIFFEPEVTFLTTEKAQKVLNYQLTVMNRARAFPTKSHEYF